MRQPFRRFLYVLAEKLSMPISEITTRMDSKEISEWMAYFLTTDEKWQDRYKREAELRASREMLPEKRADQLKRLFGVK